MRLSVTNGLADLRLVNAWTGLRWSELRAIRVRDFIEVPRPVLAIRRASAWCR